MINTAPKPSDSFETPDWLFDRLHSEFHFTLDAAASATNAKLLKYYTLEDDGLDQSWVGETVWCNPPYSGRNLGHWAQKCCEEHYYHGATVVMLVPVSVSSLWWRNFALKAEIFYFTRRIKFNNLNNTGLRDSVLLVYRAPRWYPLGNLVSDQVRRAQWDHRWRDLMYPAVDRRLVAIGN